MTTKRKQSNQQSWESVAITLASRLIFNDDCPNVDYTSRGPEPRHPHWDVGLMEGCPFCEDRYAMACYYAKRMGKVQPVRPVDSATK